MLKTQFYFLSSQYYKDFPDGKIMKNKEFVNGHSHNRPCFFAFSDAQTPDILWLVPISSKIDKYRQEAQKKITRYGHCNTIRFGTVLGRESAFLIQNMCPVTEKYIIAYMDKNKQPIRIDNRLSADIVKNAKEVLSISKRGAKVIFPNVKIIYEALQLQLEQEKAIPSETPLQNKFQTSPVTTTSIRDRFAAAQLEADKRNKISSAQQSENIQR